MASPSDDLEEGDAPEADEEEGMNPILVLALLMLGGLALIVGLVLLAR